MNDQNKRVARAVALLIIVAIATTFYSYCYFHNNSYLAVRAYAGDSPLPGASWFPSATETIALATEAGDTAKDFHAVLELDTWLVLLILLFMLSVAYLGRQRMTSKGLVRALLVSALIYA